MEAMRATTAVCSLPILRPVVGMDKEEIVRIARKINTFETSILPYEDCCTVFTPRHPRLRPVLGELEAAEAALDVEGLVKAAVDGIERVAGVTPIPQSNKGSAFPCLIPPSSSPLAPSFCWATSPTPTPRCSLRACPPWVSTSTTTPWWGDNPERLRAAVETAKTRADIILTTGGLGPTCDDLTKNVLAACFGKKAGVS